MRIAVGAVLAWATCVSPAAADRVDDYVRAQLEARHLPGVSVAVVKDGRLVKAEGYGVASLELDAPATSRTVYEIGSISKQFAANAILLLVEDGKLRLDDLVSKYIDQTPPAWSTMTLRHVLTHHGERLRPAIIAPNGGILINVVDLAAWDMAITQGRLLRAESMKEMTTPVRLTNGRTISHGLGWFMDRFNGHSFGAHWGTTVAGYSAVIRRYVDDGLTVIVLANMDEGGGFAVDRMSKAIADMYVPGLALPSLSPIADPKAAAIELWTAVLTSVANGVEHPDAPGLAKRLPPLVRARLAAAIGASSSSSAGATAAARIEFLGEERISDGHFNVDPALVSLRRYRASTAAGTRYLTLRLSAKDQLLGVIIED